MDNQLKRLSLFICVGLMAFGWIQANNSSATAMAFDKNDKIVLVGVADNGLTNDFALTRLNLDGSPDNTFNAAGSGSGFPSQVVTDLQGTDDAIAAVAIDANNKIVVAGVTQDPVTNNNEFAVARYNNDGSLDVTFNANATLPGAPGFSIITVGGISDIAFGLALDSLGRIVVVGTSDNGLNTDIAIVRLTVDGALDTTFTSNINVPGIVTIGIGTNNDTATCVTIGEADAIFVGGFTSDSQTTQVVLAKLDSNGMLDQNFFVQTTSPFPGVILQSVNGVQDQINTIGIDVNQSLVLGGFTTVNDINSITNFLLVRYTQAGDLFETIQTNINASNSVINALTFDADNKIVVTGSYDTGTQNFNFLTGANLAFVTARYNLDGSLDSTFNPNAFEGSFNALPGLVITNVIPPVNTSFGSVDNLGTGVITDAQNRIYVTGFSSDGSQTNFTTLSYLTGGGLNVSNFNTIGLQAGDPGEVFNVFFGQLQLGNGVPLFLGGNILGLGTQILDELRPTALDYVTPVILSDGPLVTNDSQPILNGTASPNATIALLVNEIPMGTTLANNKGDWSATLPPLLDGTYSIIALSTEPLTSINLSSVPVSLTINTQAPDQPIINQPTKEQVVRSSITLVQGNAQPNSVVAIFIENGKAGEAKVGSSGTWSHEVKGLQDGRQQVYAVATDKAGNVSIPSEIITFIVDTGKPRPPRILAPFQGSVIRKSPTTITGEGKPGASINIFLNDKVIGNVKATADAKWFFNMPLKSGDYSLYAAAESDKKSASEIIRFTVDLTPIPTAKKLPLLRGLFNGQATPGSGITLFLDGSQLGKVVTDELGAWSYTPPPDKPISKGKHLLKVSIADPMGKITTLVEQEITL